jgi:serine/threonine protein kinase
MTEESRSPPPLRFGKYSLLDRFAVGEMAEVFLAREAGVDELEKTIVLKRIRPHLCAQRAFTRIFVAEARKAAQLHHPNIVQIYEVGKVGESYFVAMEYIFGRNMSRILRKAERAGVAFPMVYALKIASAVLQGLGYAHEKRDPFGNPLGIVHRDIIPENIFVSFDGTVKILDFGIARAASRIEHAAAFEVRPHLSYMSPEQCAGKPLDHRSDLFSLGVVLYEWVTGFKLFTGDDPVAVLRAVTEGKIYAPSYFKAEIPDAVERILLKALERNPDKRYASAAEMQADIDQFLARYEFTPNASHLANLLHQVFADELEEEKERITTGRRSGGPLLEVVEAPSDENPPIPLRPKPSEREPVRAEPPSDRVLTVSVTDEIYEQL